MGVQTLLVLVNLQFICILKFVIKYNFSTKSLAVNLWDWEKTHFFLQLCMLLVQPEQVFCTASCGKVCELDSECRGECNICYQQQPPSMFPNKVMNKVHDIGKLAKTVARKKINGNAQLINYWWNKLSPHCICFVTKYSQ